MPIFDASLAKQIADSLFTNGAEKADRLVLTADRPSRDLGGWNYEAAVRQIERILSSSKADADRARQQERDQIAQLHTELAGLDELKHHNRALAADLSEARAEVERLGAAVRSAEGG